VNVVSTIGKAAEVLAEWRCADVHAFDDVAACEACKSWGAHAARALASAGLLASVAVIAEAWDEGLRHRGLHSPDTIAVLESENPYRTAHLSQPREDQ
jgi:hypothetical protein